MAIELGRIRVFSVDELAEKLDLNKNTIQHYLREGKLKGKKMAGKWYITEESLLEFFNSGNEQDEDLDDETKKWLWEKICKGAGETFYTKSGEEFTYGIEGNSVKTTRTDYTVHRKQFEKGYELFQNNIVSGPGQMTGIVGASYIWGILTKMFSNKNQ